MQIEEIQNAFTPPHPLFFNTNGKSTKKYQNALQNKAYLCTNKQNKGGSRKSCNRVGKNNSNHYFAEKSKINRQSKFQ